MYFPKTFNITQYTFSSTTEPIQVTKRNELYYYVKPISYLGAVRWNLARPTQLLCTTQFPLSLDGPSQFAQDLLCDRLYSFEMQLCYCFVILVGIPVAYGQYG